MEQLMLTVSLVDKVTRPIQGINQQIRETGELGRQSMDRMISGAAGLAASGVALYQALMPAIEMDNALSEVKSLGVVQQDLDQLSQTATEFSIEFGKSATEFVGAAYDIKSAMGDLTGDELAGITKSSAVLAAATKADTATVTAYMGTMYGVFKKQADAMGRDNFAAMVAGQTAQAVESFKTTGAEMSAAFTSIGAAGTAAGIAMHEQMAVLGTLQATMSGSEAGTKYKAFLAGIAGAQDKLNMSFVDGNGNMLGMVQILQKLKDKFGDTLTVAESDALKKAFGSDEAVALIKQMIPDVDGLAASIDNVGKQTGMDKATQMAGAMTDQWQRLEHVWFALRAGAGASVLPTINAVVGSIVDGMAVLVEWTDMFPHLTEVVTWAAIGIASLTAVAASWTLIMGIGGGILTFYKGGIMGVVKVLRLLRIGLILSRTLTLAWAAVTATGTAAVWLFNAALAATRVALAFITGPFGLIMMALVAVGAGAVWLARNWDSLKASIMESEAFATLMGFLDTVQLKWQSFMDTLANLGPIKLIGSAINWLIEKINLIPGIDIDLGSSMELPETPDMPAATQQIAAGPQQAAAVPPATQQVSRTLQPVPTDVAPASQLVNQHWPETANTDLPAATQQVDRDLQPVQAGIAPLKQDVFREYFDDLDFEFSPATQEVNRVYTGGSHVGGSFIHSNEALFLPSLVPESPLANTPTTQPHVTDTPAVKSDQLMAGINEQLRTTRTPESVQSPPSPLMPQLAKVANQNNGKTVHFGDVHIKNEQGMDPGTLAEWEELQHGF
ncbi:phage tail tape measure protein [Oceanimonas sp. AH20CE76]|uniref:phage tail tape measure protein n=1 Tax=Oceanimonas sp. AH20CE76 TaxID=2977120 RepID=UPI0031FED13D